MKITHLSAAAFTVLFTGCDVKVSNPPPAGDTTIVNPPAEKKVEHNTTIVNPPAEKKVENNTTIINPPAKENK